MSKPIVGYTISVLKDSGKEPQLFTFTAILSGFLITLSAPPQFHCEALGNRCVSPRVPPVP